MKLTDNLYYYPQKGMPDCNTYVIKDKTTVLIDPGFSNQLPALLKDIEKDGINPQDIDIITNTHLHPDHFMGDENAKKATGAKIYLHPRHQEFLDFSLNKIAVMLGFSGLKLKPDEIFEDNKLSTGDLELEFIHSPGHSPDSICFYSKQGKFLVCGDVVFDRNTGRVDMPSGSGEELKESIERLAKLTDIEYLLPGHMDIVNGIDNVKNNFNIVREYVFPYL